MLHRPAMEVSSECTVNTAARIILHPAQGLRQGRTCLLTCGLVVLQLRYERMHDIFCDPALHVIDCDRIRQLVIGAQCDCLWSRLCVCSVLCSRMLSEPRLLSGCRACARVSTVR